METLVYSWGSFRYAPLNETRLHTEPSDGRSSQATSEVYGASSSEKSAILTKEDLLINLVWEIITIIF